jgi:hypothetical protein
MVTRLLAGKPRNRDPISGRSKGCSVPHSAAPRQALRSTQATSVCQILFSGVKRPDLEGNYPPLAGAEAKMSAAILQLSMCRRCLQRATISLQFLPFMGIKYTT